MRLWDRMGEFWICIQWAFTQVSVLINNGDSTYQNGVLIRHQLHSGGQPCLIFDIPHIFFLQSKTVTRETNNPTINLALQPISNEIVFFIGFHGFTWVYHIHHLKIEKNSFIKTVKAYQKHPKTYRLTQSCERNMPSSSSIPTLNWKALPPAAFCSCTLTSRGVSSHLKPRE